MKKKELEKLTQWFVKNHQKKLKGRRITLKQILPILKSLNSDFRIKKIGTSYLKNDIYKVSIGSGNKTILIWTQMHGNESTGTKALFDLFEFLGTNREFSSIAKQILKEYTIVSVPILNPDGAIAYTRVNAQHIDLNRDVIDKKAIESNILQDLLKEVDPIYCFNMHDQRTIFSVGKNKNPATISFLAPSINIERTITAGRKQTMNVIVHMYHALQELIPNQIGRYTDEFYPTATGDNFQKMGHNTILIESGHFKDDYQREETRKYTFLAMLQGLIYLANTPIDSDYKEYFNIPDNEKLYLDIILKNVMYKSSSVDIGILFKECLIDNTLNFIPGIEITGNLSNYNANSILDDLGLEFSGEKDLLKWLKNEFN